MFRRVFRYGVGLAGIGFVSLAMAAENPAGLDQTRVVLRRASDNTRLTLSQRPVVSWAAERCFIVLRLTGF